MADAPDLGSGGAPVQVQVLLSAFLTRPRDLFRQLSGFLRCGKKESDMSDKQRVYIWDNLKCFLMISVVLGHFVNQYPDSSFMRSMSIIIYSYHMPLFIFVAGLLQKRWTRERPFRWDKPVYYIILGYLLKVLIYAIKTAFGKDAVFSLFTDTGIPWYMFAMAAYMVIAYVIRKKNPKVCLPVSVILALLAGYVDGIGSFLYISRILVFFPFYYAGYLLDSDTVLAFTRKKWLRLCAVAVLAAGLFISFYWIDDIFSIIRMFTGRNAYAFIRVAGCGLQHRLLCYVITVIVSTALISLMPGRRIRLAEAVGSRTLQIYFWHRLILYVMMYSGFCDAVRSGCGNYWIPVYLLIAVLLTFVLSLDFFGWPLRKIKDLQMRIRDAM